MEKKISFEAWILSMNIIVVSWRIHSNQKRMGKMIAAGERYTSERLIYLDDHNKKLGQKLHTLVDKLLKKRLESKERAVGYSKAA